MTRPPMAAAAIKISTIPLVSGVARLLFQLVASMTKSSPDQGSGRARLGRLFIVLPVRSHRDLAPPHDIAHALERDQEWHADQTRRDEACKDDRSQTVGRRRIGAHSRISSATGLRVYLYPLHIKRAQARPLCTSILRCAGNVYAIIVDHDNQNRSRAVVALLRSSLLGSGGGLQK
jgi:hypothetical protein